MLHHSGIHLKKSKKERGGGRKPHYQIDSTRILHFYLFSGGGKRLSWHKTVIKSEFRFLIEYKKKKKKKRERERRKERKEL